MCRADPAPHPLVARVVPAGVVVVETAGQHQPTRTLSRREQEFACGRACARDALRLLGHPEVAIPRGIRGEPRWPPGVVASISHTQGWTSVGAAAELDLAALGVDVEQHRAFSTDAGANVWRLMVPPERDRLRALREQRSDIRWETVLFSVKESVFKAWYPAHRRWLGFGDIDITLGEDDLDEYRAGEAAGDVQAIIRAAGRQDAGLVTGRYLVTDGLIATAAWGASVDPPVEVVRRQARFDEVKHLGRQT